MNRGTCSCLALHLARPQPRALSWMKSLHGLLHGKLWIMFHSMLEVASHSPPRIGPNTNSRKPCQWYGLWMKIKCSHTHMVTALDLCAK